MQFASFKTSRSLLHFNPKCAPNFTAATAMELTYADMYTDQFVLLAYRAWKLKAAVNGRQQYSPRRCGSVEAIKTPYRHWENDRFKEWCKSRIRRCGFLSGENCCNILYVLPSICPSFHTRIKNEEEHF